MLCADANFEVNTRSIYASNYDFLSVAIKKISTVFLSPTFSKSTEEHGEAAEEEGEGARPPPSQPVDPHDTEQVRRQLHGRGDHEGEVELKVEVGEVPHCRVVNTTHQHPEENAQHTQLPHLRCLEEIQIGVLGPALSHCEVNFYFDIYDSFTCSCFAPHTSSLPSDRFPPGLVYCWSLQSSSRSSLSSPPSPSTSTTCRTPGGRKERGRLRSFERRGPS